MDLHLNGKSVVVTGGGTGIGEAVALEFAREGAIVTICGRRLERLRETAQKAAAQGLHIRYFQVDVTDTKAVEIMAGKISDECGGIDVWINNAGIAINRPALSFTEEEYRRIVATNMDAVFFCSQIAARHMIAQGRGGVILNAESYAVKIPHAQGAVYAATKAAVQSFVRSFAANLAPYGIRVVGYIPGMIVSEISEESIRENRRLYTQNIAMQRLGHPEDLAKTLVFLASDAAAYISGTEVEIAGGKYAVQDSEYPWKQAGMIKNQGE